MSATWREHMEAHHGWGFDPTIPEEEIARHHDEDHARDDGKRESFTLDDHTLDHDEVWTGARSFNFLPTVTVLVRPDGQTKIEFSWDATLQGEVDADGNFIENAEADAVAAWIDSLRSVGLMPESLYWASGPSLA